jgi:hypothetical protein
LHTIEGLVKTVNFFEKSISGGKTDLTFQNARCEERMRKFCVLRNGMCLSRLVLDYNAIYLLKVVTSVSSVKMEATCSSETLVSTFKFTRRYNPEQHRQWNDVNWFCTTISVTMKFKQHLIFRKQQFELGQNSQGSSAPSGFRCKLPQVSSVFPVCYVVEH